jgi:osmoprotectant transport system ATP-binding protein
MIELKNVSKGYNGVSVLKNIKLGIYKGERISLIGPSGCGKSTILRLIVALIEPTSGMLEFENQPYTKNNIREIRHKIGYVIQKGGLFPHLTALDNVLLPCREYKIDLTSIKDSLQKYSEILELTDVNLKKYPSELSGGQYQRVALLRAMITDPEILLLDEPLGALDPIVRRKLQSTFTTLFEKLNKTVLLVTHDLSEAEMIGDECILMYHGEVVQRGKLSELIKNPENAFVQEFCAGESQ